MVLVHFLVVPLQGVAILITRSNSQGDALVVTHKFGVGLGRLGNISDCNSSRMGEELTRVNGVTHDRTLGEG